MAFTGVVSFTSDGLLAQERAQLGKPLKFTKIVLGNGEYAGSIRSLKKVVSETATLPTVEKRIISEGVVYIAGIFENSNLTQGFYWREIGLYALDPETQTEILYCYGNAGATAEWIPPGSSTTILSRKCGLNAIIGEATNISVSLPGTALYVTFQEFNEFKQIVNPTELQTAKDLSEVSRRVYYPDSHSTATEILVPVPGLITYLDYPDDLRLTIVPQISSLAGEAKSLEINQWGPKPLRKQGSLLFPKLTTGKAINVWLSKASDCFFVEASAEGNATQSQVLADYTFSNDDDTGLVGTMPNNAAVTITPGATAKTIPLGYHNGVGKVVGDADLIPANIIKGKDIFGVVGTADIVPNLATSTEKYIVIFVPSVTVPGGEVGAPAVTAVSMAVNMACLLECDIGGSYDGYYNSVYYQIFLGATALTPELGGITGGAPVNISLQVPGPGTLIIKLRVLGGYSSNTPGYVRKIRLYAKIT